MIKPPVLTTIQELPYLELGWKLFEHLCKRLVAGEEPQATEVRLYLSEGHKQHGIDGYAYDQHDRKYIHFQCKCETDFDDKKITKAVDKFLKGKLVLNSKKFILCVSAHINGQYEDELDRQRKQLAEKNILFVSWDQRKLDDLLKGYPQLVYEFFDGSDVPNWVKAFCGPDKIRELSKPVNPRSYSEPPAFVERVLYPVGQHDGRLESDKQSTALTDLLIADVLAGSCRIFMRSEAGMGKSTELLNAAYRLSNYNLALIFPVLLPLKNYVNEELPAWLDVYQPGWRSIDESTLLLLFDGLDEVKADERENFIRRVRSFIDAHPACHVLISCRTNFANSQLQFEQFTAYDLRAFDKANIVAYAEKRLTNDQVVAFLPLLEDQALVQWLENPFSLIHFVEFFQADPTTVPRTRAKLLARVILEPKLNDDLARFHSLNDPDAYYRLHKRLAFVMNLLGINSLAVGDLPKLFLDAVERERWRQSALLRESEGRISFEHNILQEYFAALALAEQPFERLMYCITFRPDYERIKPKWLNTIGILLEILPSQSSLLREVVSLVSHQEPDLLLSVEYAHFDSSLRVSIVKDVLGSSERQYSRDMFYDTRLLTLADVSNNPNVLAFLIEQAGKGADWQQVESFYYLRHIDRGRLFGYEDEIVSVSLTALQTNDSYLQESALEALGHLRLSDSRLIELATGKMPNLDKFKLRDDVYRYLNAIGIAEEYIDFYIEGLAVYQKHQHDEETISYPRIGIGFIDGLKNVEQSENLHKILSLLMNNLQYIRDGTSLFAKVDSEEGDYFEALAEQVATAYINDESLFDRVLALCYTANQYFMDDVLKSLIRFFELTGTQEQVYEKIGKMSATDSDRQHQYMLSGWVLPEARLIDYVRQFNDDEISTDRIWQLIQSLNHAKREELSEQFRTQLNALGLYQFEYTDFKAHEKRRTQRDLALLENQVAFIEAINKIFDQYDTNELTRTYLIKHLRAWYELDNNLTWRYLLSWDDSRSSIKRKEVIDYLRNKENWDWYVVGKYLNLTVVTPTIQQQVETWFYAKLPETNFRTAIGEVPVSNGQQYTARWLETRIAQLFKYGNFTVPQEILLDMLSFDIYGLNASYDPDSTQTLTQKILQQLGESAVVRNRILENLREGFASNMLLQNHIALCRHLKITDALPLIKPVILDDFRLEDYQRRNALTAYIELGGLLDDMSSIFAHFNADVTFHWHLLDEFAKLPIYRYRVGALLTKQIQNCNILADNLRAITLLIEVGSEKGLRLYEQFIRTNNIMPIDTYVHLGFVNLPAQVVAESMIGLLQYALEHDLGVGRFDHPADTFIAYLKSIAFKEENTYQYIMKKLAELAEEYEGREKHFSLRYNLVLFEKEYYLQKIDYATVQDAVLAIDEYNLSL